MRFIIREQAYEHLLASGLFVYSKEGVVSGTREEWRLTKLIDGFRTLRIDVDERERIQSGSTLYHLLLNPSGSPNRLKWQQFGNTTEKKLDIHFSENSVIVYSDIGKDHSESELAIDQGYVLLIPAVSWVGQLIGRDEKQQELTAVTFSEEDEFKARSETLRFQYQSSKILQVSNIDIEVQNFMMSWQEWSGELAVDAFGLAVELTRDDGCSARETRYIRHLKYQQQ